MDKKTKRISVRIPYSWKAVFRARGISISYVCRSALIQAMNQSDYVLKSGSKLRSKERAAALFNELLDLRVRTISHPGDTVLMKSPVKIPRFRTLLSEKCLPNELAVLAEFLDQGEFAEEILQEVYR